jgi:hypothetical protein
MMRRLALVLALACSGPACAQVAEQVRQTTREEVLRLERQARETQETREFFKGMGGVRPTTQYGGWSSYTYITIDELDHDRRGIDPVDQVRLSDQRFWISRTFDARRQAYLRLRKLDFDIHVAPGIPIPDFRTKEAFDVDLGFYDFPIGDTQVRAGRQFVAMGNGLVLAQALDGVVARHRYANGIELGALAATSLERTDNLDTRVAGFDRGHNDRHFVGLEGHYRTKRRKLRLHGFALRNIDETRSELPAQNFQDFQYQSRYIGAGVAGTLHRRLDFATEWIDEGGSSAGFDGRADIDAYAVTTNLAYRFLVRGTPTLTLDHAIGSGDPNRFSVTSSLDLGPSRFAGDENFLYFGQYDGGLALAPRLSNLEVLRVGLQGHPFTRWLRWPSDMLAGFKASTYHKHRVTGGISDPLGFRPLSDVGAALDVFVSCRALSDVNFLLEYGTFKPSSAFVSRDLTSKLAATATVSF